MALSFYHFLWMDTFPPSKWTEMEMIYGMYVCMHGHCILYEFQQRRSATGASGKLALKAFGEGKVSGKTCRRWFEKFWSFDKTDDIYIYQTCISNL